MNTELNTMIDELLELSLDEMDVVTAGRKQEQADKVMAPGEQNRK